MLDSRIRRVKGPRRRRHVPCVPAPSLRAMELKWTTWAVVPFILEPSEVDLNQLPGTRFRRQGRLPPYRVLGLTGKVGLQPLP